jgi:hypothetical protein
VSSGAGLIVVVLAALSCTDRTSTHPASTQASGTSVVKRAEVLGSFLDRHWQLPIPPQGPAPAGWSEAEASLDPAACGACHPQQHAQWKGSLHAAAYSPGFAGQLIEGSLAAPAELRNCQTCHAPLSEQQPFDASGATNSAYDAELRQSGIVCASCHVRSHRRFGPARRAEIPEPDPIPHAGYEVRAEFEESRFCAPCHQFFDEEGVAGKPIENTFVEWQQSPQAAEGRSCQSCHMPDRQHLWRGIHDPETVRAAIDVDLAIPKVEGDRLRGALVLHSRDVGHAFPTYVTPRVFLALWQEDEDGEELPGTRLEAAIGREIDFSTQPWSEVFDTRVAPGESVKLDYDVVRDPRAEVLVGRVTVDPDYHYRGVYAALLEGYTDADARSRIEEAYRRTTESSYVLSEVRRSFGAAGLARSPAAVPSR